MERGAAKVVIVKLGQVVGTGSAHAAAHDGRTTMRSILLYFIGVPIPVILLLAMCTHHF